MLRKQTIPLATALGRVTTTLLANPMGISITALLATPRGVSISNYTHDCAEETNKVWGYDPLEKVTGHQDDKPSTAETSQ